MHILWYRTIFRKSSNFIPGTKLEFEKKLPSFEAGIKRNKKRFFKLVFGPDTKTEKIHENLKNLRMKI